MKTPNYIPFCRQPKTLQEMREAQAAIEQGIKPRRKKLPTSWDDDFIHTEKLQRRRSRKQWQKRKA